MNTNLTENKNVQMGHGQLRILMIGAHPDDCDILTGGIALKYRQLGHIVKFVSATNGNAGHHKLRGYELARIRREEARQAGLVAGIEYQVLDIDDGKLEASISNRETFISLIREYEPNLIFTHRTNDYHPDHRNTGILVQDSSYLVMVPNICPQVKCLKHQPVILHMFDDFRRPIPFRPDIVIGIDSVFDKKAEMVNCHKSQFYEWLPWVDNEVKMVPASEPVRAQWLKGKVEGWDKAFAERYREKLVERYGQEKGMQIKYAEAFEISEYGGPIPQSKLAEYFLL